MAVLRSIVAGLTVVVSACYAPELRDCAVSCSSAADCAPSQVCGGDSWCAAPELAGRCTQSDGGVAVDAARDDAATVVTDAPPTDSAPPDAPGPVILVVQIMGHGTVSIPSLGTCNDHAPNHQCTFAVAGGVPRQLAASGTEGAEFENWTSVACAGQGATCTMTPLAPTTTVAAKFKADQQD